MGSIDNLLPDSVIIRNRIQRRFGVPSQQAFDLLSEIGRDCIGAVQLLPEGQVPSAVRTISCKPLSEQEVEGVLQRTTAIDLFRTGERDDFRISLAGAQEKNALMLHNNIWSKPIGTTPSTHIFKLPIGDVGFADMSTSVENEWLCMQILSRYGIETADCRLEQFGEIKTLVVKRFDRRLSGNGEWIMRLPQEDLCQAAGLPSAAAVGINNERVVQIIQEIIDSTPAVIEEVKSSIPLGFPEFVADSILGGLKTAVERLST
ncbi:MAG TPA: hypothetical protein DCO79_00645 [Spirochaeta sp.]|nr:hypothetical protein [Spirochaeta sp.]